MLRKPLLTLGLVAATALAFPAFAQDGAADAAPETQATTTDAATAESGNRDRRAWTRGWRGKHADHARRGGDRRGTDKGRFGHGAGPMPMLRMLSAGFDADGDGVVTRDEMKAGLAALVEKHDADGDGSLNLDEFAALHAELTRPLTVRAFQFIDADGDGVISPEERARAEDMLTRRLPTAPKAEAE